jgi:cytochrome c556
MKKQTVFASLLLTGVLALPQLTVAHFDDKEIPQSYRQSFFTLLVGNFGPMAAMVEGEMPWNDQQLAAYAKDFAAVTQLNLMRGFADGSDKGTTRAKPEIWQNKVDFEAKFKDLQDAAAALNTVAVGGDKKAIAQAVGAAGEACKSCHDEYKAKNYLY